MKQFKQTLKFIGLYLAVEIAIEIIAGIAWGVYYKAANPGVSISEAFDTMPSLMGLLLGDVTNAIIVLIAWKYKVIRLPECMKISNVNWSMAALPLILGVCWIICELFIDDLSNIAEDETVAKVISECAHSPLGLLSICIIGPIFEELIMREGVLGSMLRNKVNPWMAIVLSALLFGGMHLNLSQFVAGSIAGIVLGVLYWKTGNIVLSSIIHILNNTICMIGFLLTEDLPDDAKMYDFLGGQGVGFALCGVFAVICAVLLVKYVKREEEV